LEFPPSLTNTERRFIHELAAQLGVKSKSTGKGENRRITVSKLSHRTRKPGDELDDIPLLRVGKRGENALEQHFARFPPNHEEELESHETGASLMEAMASDIDDAAKAKRLQQLAGLGNLDRQAASVRRKERPIDLEKRKQVHAAYQKRKQSNPKYASMLQLRARLPAYAHQEEVVRTVAANAVTIVSGETGCGKSTQVPQFLLDANSDASIVVTQPRRLSAMSLAERVAVEQCSGHAVGQHVGYQVRLDAVRSEHTQLLFLTPGVLLRQMQSSPLLNQYTHVSSR
jgi:HrpA-like RNA helicase